MKSTVRIGTRQSELAVWQARHVQQRLEQAGVRSELVFIHTEGDRVLDTPLPLMGGKGVFTKALDDALLGNEIDLAVHSYKDLPTEGVPGITVAAVLERADVRDALVPRQGLAFLEEPKGEESAVIATGSLRRQAQWLHRYPHHRTADIRGNVNTRLQKVTDTPTWAGAIFAAAGLQRLGLQHRIALYLDWMLPAPAQGAIAVGCRTSDAPMQQALQPLHHPPTAACTAAERALLNELEGGCSAPLGALATVHNGQLVLQAGLFSLDGRECRRQQVQAPFRTEAEADDLGRRCAHEMLDGPGRALVEAILRQHAERHAQ
jgi:hydroxymethylbilane synthase